MAHPCCIPSQGKKIKRHYLALNVFFLFKILLRFTTERPEIIRYFLSLLTHLVIFEESQIQFALSRPVLVLILLNETVM